MSPVKISALPKQLPNECVYLFSEGDQHLYVGRTNHFRNRMRQHSIPASQHNQAVFAFRLARLATGRTEVAYATAGGRVALAAEPEFAIAFSAAKARVRQMDLRFVEEGNPLRQALLEIYVAVVLNTPHNSFENR
jgi:predicted GIY-YIG superfamily endonuclease